MAVALSKKINDLVRLRSDKDVRSGGKKNDEKSRISTVNYSEAALAGCRRGRLCDPIISVLCH